MQVSDGVIRARTGETSYWILAEDALLDREATGAVPTKRAADLAIIGRSVPRLDLPDKVFGAARFIHDLELPQMLHGRIVRPTAPLAALAQVDVDSVAALQGVVTVVRDGSLLGVIASSERDSVRAAERLAAIAQWDAGEALPDENAMGEWLQREPADATVISTRTLPAAPEVARTVRATFDNPDFELKPGMYADAAIVSEPVEDALQVPQEAVIDTGTKQIVFVAQGDGHFSPRSVRAGLQIGRAHV